MIRKKDVERRSRKNANFLILLLVASATWVTIFGLLQEGLAFLSYPGEVIEVMLVGFLLLAVLSGNQYPQLQVGADKAINVMFYSLLIFVLLNGIAYFSRKRHDFLK